MSPCSSHEDDNGGGSDPTENGREIDDTVGGSGSGGSSSNNDNNPSEDEPPIIDMTLPEPVLVQRIAEACSTWGFFQLTNHGVDPNLVSEFRSAMLGFFALPRDVKLGLRRDGSNARGYFDDELTKRRRDWKEAIDVGVPGSRDWSLPDGDGRNECLDGVNRLPPPDVLPDLRPTVVRYFQECEVLSDRIAVLMGKGLGLGIDGDGDGDGAAGGEAGRRGSKLLEDLRARHTSYLRTNYYPPHIPNAKEGAGGGTVAGDGNAGGSDDPPPLGISPHKDAGFLTVLVQDDDCHSLQVARFEDGDESKEPEWITVVPKPGAFTINTGDMAMIWSNGRYRAPLHRVLTSAKPRISAPFFYNPGFETIVEPLATLNEEPRYFPVSWGYFRAVRFAGDFTDIGVEIQISDFERGGLVSPHIDKQAGFLQEVDFDCPFSVERYRPLLEIED